MANETPKISEQAKAKSPTGFDPSKVKVKKHVTLPLLKLSVGAARYVRFDSAIFRGKELKGNQEAEAGKTAMEPADIANVTNLEDGKPYQMIINAVCKSRLEEEYPDAAYKGLAFAITKLPKRDGKKYNEFEILEIEV